MTEETDRELQDAGAAHRSKSKVQMEMWEGRIRKVVQGKAERRLAAGEGRKPWLCSVPDFLAVTKCTTGSYIFATVHRGGGCGENDGRGDMAEVALCWWDMHELPAHISVDQEVETGQKGWTVTLKACPAWRLTSSGNPLGEVRSLPAGDRVFKHMTSGYFVFEL